MLKFLSRVFSYAGTSEDFSDGRFENRDNTKVKQRVMMCSSASLTKQ